MIDFYNIITCILDFYTYYIFLLFIQNNFIYKKLQKLIKRLEI